MINRFEWIKAVLRSDVSDRARTLATALALEFFNDATGQLNPYVPTLAGYLQRSSDTVKRAVAELEAAGWLVRSVGRGRGNSTNYVMVSPGNVVPMRPVTTTQDEPKRVQKPTRVARAKGGKPARKRGQTCTSHIRKEQSSEQRGRAKAPAGLPATAGHARPSPHLTAPVSPGSWQAGEWDRWLADRRLPCLSMLRALQIDGTFVLPWSRPPTSGDQTGEGIALRVIEWAERRNGRALAHDDAA